MPRHDYRCPICRFLLQDQIRSVAEGGRASRPECPRCHFALMDWIPQARFDLMTDGTTFPKFTTTDGRGQRVEIDSLHKLRQVEQDSEVAARNGEGQQMVFRNFSQSRGNRLDGALGTAPSQQPSAAAKAKFGLRGAASPVSADAAQDLAYGPGVSDANTSALPEASGE